MDLQRNGNFEDDEKTSNVMQRPVCSTDFVAGTTFCACGAKQTTLSKEQEEQAPHSLQEGFACIQALISQSSRYDLELLRGNVYGQSRAQQQCGKVKDHHQKAVAKGV